MQIPSGDDAFLVDIPTRFFRVVMIMTEHTSAKFAPYPAPEVEAIALRQPVASDGPALHDLVAACAPLDANSRYCNLLHCTHFATTSVAATRAGELVGFISGYLLPTEPRTLFVWQVAVAPSARRQRLAQRMLRDLLQRPACRHVEFLHTTVTPDNRPSRALFSSLARALSAPLQESIWLESERHFSGAHDDEVLLEIGPFLPAPMNLHMNPP